MTTIDRLTARGRGRKLVVRNVKKKVDNAWYVVDVLIVTWCSPARRRDEGATPWTTLYSAGAAIQGSNRRPENDPYFRYDHSCFFFI